MLPLIKINNWQVSSHSSEQMFVQAQLMTFGKISGKLANNPNWPSVFLHLVLKCCGILTRNENKMSKLTERSRTPLLETIFGGCLVFAIVRTRDGSWHSSSLVTVDEESELMSSDDISILQLSEIMFSHSTTDSWLIHHIASFTGRIIKFKSCSHNATFTYIPSPQIIFYLVRLTLKSHVQIWCAENLHSFLSPCV